MESWAASREAALRVLLGPKPDSVTAGDWEFANECAVTMAKRGASGETIRAALASVFGATEDEIGPPGGDPANPFQNG